MHDGSMSHMLYPDLYGKVPSACVKNENQNLIHMSRCGFHDPDAGMSWKHWALVILCLSIIKGIAYS